MSASAIYFLDIQGKVIISRNYRGDINMNIILKFMPVLTCKEEDNYISPIINIPECSFVYIRHNNLYIVFTSKQNSNAMLLINLLYKIVNLMKIYIKELEEESIKDNFVVIYELLDEIIDFGYPQTTESNILQEYITQESHKLEIQPHIPMAVTNAISWRSEGIKYSKNELFLDIIEQVNVLINAKGNVIRNEISGSIQMKVHLSGMPELILILNDKVLFENNNCSKNLRLVEIEDIKFHQCVCLSKFEDCRTISFIPPDGEFELMSYRTQTLSKPVIFVESIVNRYAHSRVNYIIKAKSQFKRRSTAKFVELIVPVPNDVDSPEFQSNMGKVTYSPERNAVIWLIKSFPGGKEFLMRANFKLPSVESEILESKHPILVKFEIPYFTVSGVQAKNLKVKDKNNNQQAVPWVRYVTKNGEYQIRTN